MYLRLKLLYQIWPLAILCLMAGCAAPQQGITKEIEIAELKGERAGIEKEIELQNAAISDLQARIDSGADKIPGVRVLGPGPSEIKQDKIRERLITLTSDLARIDGEINALSPSASSAP